MSLQVSQDLLANVNFHQSAAKMRQQLSLHNRNLKSSRAPLKSQVQSTSLYMSAVTNQRGCPKG